MKKEKLLAMLRAKEAKKTELQTRSSASEDVAELRTIHAQMEEVNHDIEELRGMIAAIEAEEQRAKEGVDKQEERTNAVNNAEAEARSAQFVPGKGFESRGEADLNREEKEARKKEQEKRAKDLREGRSITVASSNIVVPSYSARTINATFQQVSSLLDAVDVLTLPGGESYKQPYEKGTASGDYTAEGTDYAEAETVFGYAEIHKTKVTAYNEVTEEVEKLPAAPYESVILRGVSTSLRKKLAKEIMIGAGSANSLTGIFSTNATAIEASTDLSIAAIDNTTLDTIIFAYGNEEAVEGACVLILNKKDLAEFARLRTSDGNKYHTIIPAQTGGFGTIDGIPYIINSACGSIADTGTSASTYCMAYGNLKNYQLAIFSEMEIKRSDDYKFKQGLICHRGVVFAGGNVVAQNGFVRVKKGPKA